MESEKIIRRKNFIINLTFYVLAAALFYFTVKYIIGWILPFLIGFAVALIFRPLIYWVVDRLHINRKIAAVIIVLLGYIVLGTLFTLLGMELASLLGRLFSNMPDFFTRKILPALTNLGDSLRNLLTLLPDLLPAELASMFDELRSSITSALTNAVSSISRTGVNAVAGVAKGIPGFLIALVFTILSSFFISQNYYGVTRFITAQFPPHVSKVLLEAKSTIAGTVGAYLKAYAKIMLITFTELTIGFLIIGVTNPLPKAFGIAIFDILPVFGTGGIVIPWIIVDLLLGSYRQALGLLIIYCVVTVVRNFIEPKIVGDQLGLNPIVSIMAIYLGYRWFGVLGMIFMPATIGLITTLHEKGVITLYKRPEPLDEEAARIERETHRREHAESAARLREERKKLRREQRLKIIKPKDPGKKS